MGVLTHLDLFTKQKQQRKQKKVLKNRFWTEIYQGAKLFYLSGVSGGLYSKTETTNLGRFISVMKFRPLQWRNTHPYVLADRMEDLTDPEEKRLDPKCDRKVCLYGYVRGTNLKAGMDVHVAGCGDFRLAGGGCFVLWSVSSVNPATTACRASRCCRTRVRCRSTWPRRNATSSTRANASSTRP
jgi:ribosome biogenesis protein BMS1